jgi:hypothetical protein
MTSWKGGTVTFCTILYSTVGDRISNILSPPESSLLTPSCLSFLSPPTIKDLEKFAPPGDCDLGSGIPRGINVHVHHGDVDSRTAGFLEWRSKIKRNHGKDR